MNETSIKDGNFFIANSIRTKYEAVMMDLKHQRTCHSNTIYLFLFLSNITLPSIKAAISKFFGWINYFVKR